MSISLCKQSTVDLPTLSHTIEHPFSFPTWLNSSYLEWHLQIFNCHIMVQIGDCQRIRRFIVLFWEMLLDNALLFSPLQRHHGGMVGYIFLAACRRTPFYELAFEKSACILIFDAYSH